MGRKVMVARTWGREWFKLKFLAKAELEMLSGLQISVFPFIIFTCGFPVFEACRND